MEFAATVGKNKFVDFSGNLCTVDENAAGITDNDYVDGDFGSVIISGTALLTIKAQLAQGDLITSDANGCGIKATTGDYVNAIAKFAGVTDANLEVLVTHFKI
jgi:hypothetical protein